MNWLRKAVILTLCAAVSLPSAFPTVARAEVDPELLFPDSELERADAMSLDQIRTFLQNKGGLSRLALTDVDGSTKSAAEIIWRVAHDYRINPKFLLALLQREQSIVEASNPSVYQLDWATGYARCDSCDADHPLVAAYRGFAKQLEGAAQRIRNNYLVDLAVRGTTQTGWGPGITKIVDGLAVTPANKATAILYTYTPHLNGNLNFARILKRWFTKGYPDGTVVKSSDGKRFWLISGGQRRPFASATAFFTRYSASQAVVIPADELGDYEEGTAIRYQNYSLLHEPDGKISLLDGDTIRHIDSMETFRRIGFSLDEVLDVPSEDLIGYAPGSPITLASAYPTGSLLQDRASGAIYWVKDGVRQVVMSKEILKVNFPRNRIVVVSSETLDSYASGTPVPFADGTLVGIQGQPRVFIISKGRRRPILSEAAFRAYGWNFANVVWTTEPAVMIHESGEPVDVPKPSDVQSAFSPVL
ncbi:hypothetical protein EPO33_01555 [Patescibacteria group bacterium]|nr:MAG: hypothetical protein EPO33_01555 [Patescibacteria group bacterium]